MQKSVGALTNMNARSACPKCDGYGYIHDSVDKHDKPDRKTRCKKCNDCNICSGSGIVVGKSACRTCKARGFVHPSGAAQKHPSNDLVACVECVECKDCINGIPRSIAKNLPRMIPNQPENPLEPPSTANLVKLDDNGMLPARAKSTLVGSSPFFDSLFSSTSAHFQQNRKNLQSRHQTPAQTLVSMNADAAFSEILKKTIDCPRCLARGWRHESTDKHDRKENVRCKTCANCKGCAGKGKVDEDKVPCTDCNLAGFLHPTAEDDPLRPHDAPSHLRCFYCQVCVTCKGIGLTTAVKVEEPKNDSPSQKPPLLFNPAAGIVPGLPVFPATPQIAPPQTQPIVQPGPPNIPTPPMLAVVMVRSPDNPEIQIPMVDLPGIGLVPAEQILKMQVPMVVMPNLGRTPSRPIPGTEPEEPAAPVVDEQELMETNNVLKDVWG
ncbi:UNVERIFIED_CONTAM: hypothetical protein HDU68_007443 [Siphonaria sp. JEL0065]|nr:hypothetical protein HDU68_007443 [Siphonaria sp. JEL0065]